MLHLPPLSLFPGFPSVLVRGGVVLLSLVFVAMARAEDPGGAAERRPVAAARWDGIEITGNETFTDERIKNELFADPEFLGANHPFENHEDFDEVVQDRLVTGYQHEGFREVQIEVTQTAAPHPPSPAKWLIQIVEGPRVLRGGVRLLGTTEIDTDRLTERLTKRFPPSDAIATSVYVNDEVITKWVDEKGKQAKWEKPVWDVEKGVPFDNPTAMHGAVGEALSDLGYSNPLVVEGYQIDESGRRGDLVIDVIELGEHDRAESIEITGLKINRRQQVLAYLGIATGDPVDRRSVQDISQRLFESGRFEKQTVKFDAKSQTLQIVLDEIGGLPRLDEPLNENAKILLKVSRWLSGIGSRGDDFESESIRDGMRMRTIFSARGVFFEIAEAADTPGVHGDLAAMIDRRQVMVDHSRLDEKLRVELHDEGQILFSHRISASPKPDKFLASRFNFHGNVPLKRGRTPLEFQFLSTPSDWIPLAYQDNVYFTRSGDELIVTHDQEHIHVDANTGRIDEWVTEDGTNRFGTGLLAAARGSLSAKIAEKPVVDGKGEPLSSLVQYLLTEPVLDSATQWGKASEADSAQPLDKPTASALRKLASGGLFSPLDVVRDWAVEDDGTETFQIPSGGLKAKSSNGIMREIAARLTLKHAHQFFEEETWPLILTREVALLVIGGTKQSGKVLQQLVNDEDTGPIGLTAIALLLEFGNSPPERVEAVSQRALSRLTPEAFAADIEILTRKINVDTLSRLRESFQSLTPAERDALAGLVDNEHWKQGVLRLHAIGQVEHPGPGEAGFWYLVFHGPIQSRLNDRISY
ncbi:BamA/TamA family outer membrane protein [Allorhodopirellula solitaria]|uniref:Outer membrane protein assembly factor BamA n=1 Tax=Allorhodopirellula solitaria TaxID=2527987 RepID=A0A5C5YDY9_9BACT|nr:hypothetical protein [Allorhodopirellula solitaria]TWT73967.1 Outer membrane protein assembly factor BamA [Allorhodopirellula solitaria]